MLDPKKQAASLLAESGPGAWYRATVAAIEAHMACDVVQREFWRDVQAELAQIAPQPGASDADIYATARRLIAEAGAAEATRIAWERAIACGSDMAGQVRWERVGDAIADLVAR